MVWIPHTDILNIEDFCPSQFYFIMAVHAATIFVGVMTGFWMGYHATSKILAESWEMRPIFKFNFYLSYLSFNVVMIAWPLKIILCISVSTYAGFIAQMIAMLANMFVIISLVTTWIARIRLELRDSRYEVSSCMNMTMIMLYSIGVIAALIGTIGLTVSWTISSIHLLDESLILIMIAGFVYLILSAIFLSVFAKTLQAITIQKRLNGGHGNGSQLFDITETEIQDKIQKYLGLAFIGLIASIISLLFKASVILFEDFEFGIQLVSWINSVDSLVNFLVLFFQYGFAAEYYYFWCKCMDNSFEQCMEKRADRIVSNRHEYTQTENDDDDSSIRDNEDIGSRKLRHIGMDSVELVPNSME
eukprot:37827_1